MRNDFTAEQLMQPITVNLPLAAILRLADATPEPAALQPLASSVGRITALPAIGVAWQGGIYAGLTIHENTPHTLVLLPGEAEGVNWKDALAWADKQGGTLPSRFDALTLFENLKAEFKPEWYWTSAPYASDASSAWVQSFLSGTQHYSYVVSGDRARAVRRFPIE